MDTFSSEAKEMASSVSPGNGPPDEFVKATKDALDHLYDFSRLNHHRLAHWLFPDDLPRGVSHAQALRQRLVDAIENLNASSRLAASARQSRAFHLLELRYLEAMSFREVMRTFALSQTQYHREQRHAIDMVADYLWDTLPEHGRAAGDSMARVGYDEAPASVSDVADSSRPTLAPIDVTARPGDDDVPLGAFLADVVQLLDPVAAQSRARLRVVASPNVAVSTDRTLLRSAVISAIGYLLVGAGPGEITLSVEQLRVGARIDLRFVGPCADETTDKSRAEKLRLSRELMRAIGGTVGVVAGESEGLVVSLGLPTRRTTLLVIDDNPDLGQLIKRFLADQNFAVSNVGSVEAGLATAQRSRPDVILLDVMLPHRDGWDALQLLRYHPSTADIPIVVCTVLDENQLARALGACAFIRKPLTRPVLLQVLAQTLAARSPLVAENQGDAARREVSGSGSIPGR